MAAEDFKAGGKDFKVNKIAALQQFHIVRRIAPLLAELAPAMSSISKVKAEDMNESQKLDQFAKIMSPLMTGLSKLSDADADFVLFRLLSSVQVKQAEFGNWAWVANESGIAMQDIELPILLQVAGKALMYNLSGFFALLPQK